MCKNRMYRHDSKIANRVFLGLLLSSKTKFSNVSTFSNNTSSSIIINQTAVIIVYFLHYTNVFLLYQLTQDADNPELFTFKTTGVPITLANFTFDFTIDLANPVPIEVTELKVKACMTPVPSPHCKFPIIAIS